MISGERDYAGGGGIAGGGFFRRCSGGGVGCSGGTDGLTNTSERRRLYVVPGPGREATRAGFRERETRDVGGRVAVHGLVKNPVGGCTLSAVVLQTERVGVERDGEQVITVGRDGSKGATRLARVRDFQAVAEAQSVAGDRADGRGYLRAADPGVREPGSAHGGGDARLADDDLVSGAVVVCHWFHSLVGVKLWMIWFNEHQ